MTLGKTEVDGGLFENSTQSFSSLVSRMSRLFKTARTCIRNDYPPQPTCSRILVHAGLIHCVGPRGQGRAARRFPRAVRADSQGISSRLGSSEVARLQNLVPREERRSQKERTRHSTDQRSDFRAHLRQLVGRYRSFSPSASLPPIETFHLISQHRARTPR